VTVVLAAGGTIGMTGDREAVPSEELPFTAPRLEILTTKPSVHLTLDEALAIAGRAAAAAQSDPVVLTTGTDCLEEVALLCALVHRGPHGVVVTGAMRPADAPGADGPANLADALAVAPETRGVVVAFAGELHDARGVRKADSVATAAFASPAPLGRVVEGRAEWWRREEPGRGLRLERLPHRVEVVAAHLGSDGALVRAAAALSDGLVVTVLGAGHSPPPFLDAVREVAAAKPVLATVRPQRGAILRHTYAFPGAEPDLRASGALDAGTHTPQAARLLLLAALATGTDPAALL
jgi:L-asparaginase